MGLGGYGASLAAGHSREALVLGDTLLLLAPALSALVLLPPIVRHYAARGQRERLAAGGSDGGAAGGSDGGAAGGGGGGLVGGAGAAASEEAAFRWAAAALLVGVGECAAALAAIYLAIDHGAFSADEAGADAHASRRELVWVGCAAAGLALGKCVVAAVVAASSAAPSTRKRFFSRWLPAGFLACLALFAAVYGPLVYTLAAPARDPNPAPVP